MIQFTLRIAISLGVTIAAHFMHWRFPR